MKELCPTCKREKPDTAELFGQKVRRILEAQGLHMKDLALMLERDETYVSRICNGRHNPSLKTMKAISSALGLTLSQLLTDVQ